MAQLGHQPGIQNWEQQSSYASAAAQAALCWAERINLVTEITSPTDWSRLLRGVGSGRNTGNIHQWYDCVEVHHKELKLNWLADCVLADMLYRE